MVQVIASFPSKHETLNSNPSTAKGKKKKEESVAYVILADY
jgi:hypothetical protein